MPQSKRRGNWKHFQCFVWWRKLNRPDDWAIIYTHHRDSGLLDVSNASVIDKALAPHGGDVLEEDHFHWAVGWIKGYSIRVYTTWPDYQGIPHLSRIGPRMADYPILDESDYSERELEATFDNIADSAWRLEPLYDLPEGWDRQRLPLVGGQRL